MQNVNKDVIRQPEAVTGSLKTALLLLLMLTSVFMAMLPLDSVFLVGALLVGLPIATLVLSHATREHAIVLLLAFVPFTGILKAVTGSRFAPLTFDLGLLVACVLYVLASLNKGKLRLRPLDLLWGSFLLVALLQMFNPNVPSLRAGIEGFRKFAFMSIAFYIGRSVISARGWSLFRVLLILASLPVAIYGIKQFVALSALDLRIIELATASEVTYLMGGVVRPFSTLPGPFHLGLYLVVVMLLTIRQVMSVNLKLIYRVLLMSIFSLQLVLLFLTRTKGNWVGLAVGIIVLILVHNRRLSHKLLILVAFAGLGVFSIVILLRLNSGASLAVLEDAIFAVTNPLDAPTFIFRLQLWKDSVFPAISKGYLFGYGTSSAGEGLHHLYAGTASDFFFSHNLFLKVLLELGVLGLALFLLLLTISIFRGWRSLRNFKQLSVEDLVLLQWSMAVAISFLVAGLVIPVLDAYPANYYFWLLLGLLSRGALKKEVTYESVNDPVSRLAEV